MSEIRKFASGATRNSEEGKLDVEGFLHPLVLQRFSLYMNKHRFLEDGTIRASDDWSKGIPKESAIKSGLRHTMDWWLEHRGYESREGIEDALCGILFNVQSYLLSVLEEKDKFEPNEALKEAAENYVKVTTEEDIPLPSAIAASVDSNKLQEKPTITNLLKKWVKQV